MDFQQMESFLSVTVASEAVLMGVPTLVSDERGFRSFTR